MFPIELIFASSEHLQHAEVLYCSCLKAVIIQVTATVKGRNLAVTHTLYSCNKNIATQNSITLTKYKKSQKLPFFMDVHTASVGFWVLFACVLFGFGFCFCFFL